MPGVDRVVAILKPYKLVEPRVPAARHGDRRARREDRRRPLRDHRRPVLGGDAGAGAGRRPRRQGGRRPHAARRRLQAAHLALRLPGPRRGGPEDAGRGPRRDRPADRHRGAWTRATWTSCASTPTCSRSAPATCRTSCCWPSWARLGRPVLLKRGAVDDDRGAADGGRVHRSRRATATSSSASAASAPSRRPRATPSTSAPCP